MRRATACFALSVFLSPADVGAQGTSVLTLLSTEGRDLTIGAEVRGALSASDFVTLGDSYVEAWALPGEPGQEVWIDLVSEDFDSYLYVVGPGLAEPLVDDDSGGACHARINLTFLDQGVFRVVASSVSGPQSGTYQLQVSESPGPAAEASCGGGGGSELAAAPTAGASDLPAAPAAGALPAARRGPIGERELTLGAIGDGRLTGTESTRGGDHPVQMWTFRGVAGQSVRFYVVSEEFDAYLIVEGPGLAEPLVNDDIRDGLNSALTVRFPETGTYNVFAGAYSSGMTGAYVVSAQEPADGAATPGATASTAQRGPIGERELTAGAAVEGRLTDASSTRGSTRGDDRPAEMWTIWGIAGQSVTISLVSDDFDAYLIVEGPGLAGPLENDDGGDDLNSALTVQFPETGMYNIFAAAYDSDSTGEYTLSAVGATGGTATTGALSSTGRVLQSGGSYQGVLSADDPEVAGLSMEIWEYEARAGETATFDLRSDDFFTMMFLTGPGIDSALSDMDSGGNRFDCRDTSVRRSAECTSSLIEFTFPEAGTYVVGVSTIDGFGAYDLFVN